MVMAEEGDVGVGYQFTFPASGISVRYGVSDELDAQGVIGFFGGLKTYAGRGLYRFDTGADFPTYAYGTLGFFSYDSYVCSSLFSCGNKTQTVLGFGGGVGLEYQFEEIPVVWNLELGFYSIKFDELNESFTGIGFGAGGTYYLDL